MKEPCKKSRLFWRRCFRMRTTRDLRMEKIALVLGVSVSREAMRTKKKRPSLYISCSFHCDNFDSIGKIVFCANNVRTMSWKIIFYILEMLRRKKNVFPFGVLASESRKSILLGVLQKFHASKVHGKEAAGHTTRITVKYINCKKNDCLLYANNIRLMRHSWRILSWCARGFRIGH